MLTHIHTPTRATGGLSNPNPRGRGGGDGDEPFLAIMLRYLKQFLKLAGECDYSNPEDFRQALDILLKFGVRAMDLAEASEEPAIEVFSWIERRDTPEQHRRKAVISAGTLLLVVKGARIAGKVYDPILSVYMRDVEDWEQCRYPPTRAP